MFIQREARESGLPLQPLFLTYSERELKEEPAVVGQGIHHGPFELVVGNALHEVRALTVALKTDREESMRGCVT
jgi:hypothetical protein